MSTIVLFRNQESTSIISRKKIPEILLVCGYIVEQLDTELSSNVLYVSISSYIKFNDASSKKIHLFFYNLR